MLVVGLMSGTSADGIDVAVCRIEGAPPRVEAEIVHAQTVPYDIGTRTRILEACQPDSGDVRSVCLLNFDLAEAFAEATLATIRQAGLEPAQIDLIGSHGQTVWHEIAPDGRAVATLQIVSGSVLAERTGITTINDFRTRDVAAGGQGAPLTSYVDWLLLRHPTKWRAVQNIGGMGNVTFLPPLNDTASTMLAFDTGPGNALIDIAAGLVSDGALTFDRDGALAAAGTISEVWLDDLMQHPYYHRTPPKTTGRELFGTDMARELVAEGLKRGLRSEDVVATLTMLTAASIADSYQQFAPAPIGEVILGGGGRSNPTLVSQLQSLVNAPVMTHEDIGINSDFKEALVFAVLAYETWHNRPAALPEQTGARHATVLGQIIPGDNYAALSRRTWSTAP